MQNFKANTLQRIYICLLLNPYSIERDYLTTFIGVLFEI